MNLHDVMGELGTQLDTIAGLRGFGFPPDRLTPPAAVVSYPEDITYDVTYGRGKDRITLPVVVVVGRPTDRTAAKKLGEYASGSGATSIKQVVEAGSYTAFDAVRVMSAEFDVFTIGGTDYMGALFMLDIGGSGS